MLHLEVSGTGEDLVLVNGFTQSARTWGRFGQILAGRRRLLALDAPGHGRSFAVEADLAAGAELMADTVIGAGAGPAPWLGYSMGGRFALHVALARPEAVSALVLISATAGIDDPAERDARRAGDEALARRLEAEGLEAFLRSWLAQPLFATLSPEAAGLDERLGGSAAGLASSLRRAGTGTMTPLWDRLGELARPVLVVAGELDAKYRALAARLAGAIGPGAELAVVPGAGHACHLEAPEAVAELVHAWLSGPGRAGPAKRRPPGAGDWKEPPGGRGQP
jgi:2-succinyl-6-hydroxy-2,4-cyclohexadiene-1-carboxylate synthase